jgi:hypothetical protein
MARHVSSICMILVLTYLASCTRDDFVWGTRIGTEYSREVVLLGREEMDLLTDVMKIN